VNVVGKLLDLPLHRHLADRVPGATHLEQLDRAGHVRVTGGRLRIAHELLLE
jgi:hypothetical protein